MLKRVVVVYLGFAPLRRHCCARLDRTGASGDDKKPTSRVFPQDCSGARLTKVVSSMLRESRNCWRAAGFASLLPIHTTCSHSHCGMSMMVA